MNKVQDEIKKAVEVGYWQLYRYNPVLKEEGKNPSSLIPRNRKVILMPSCKGRPVMLP